VVDVCPVGALTMRPSRFTARAWELRQHAGVAAHDSLGSNVWLHTRGNKVMRVVPRENEAINQVWLSDRDRYSYQALTSDDRLLTPQRKVGGQWREIDWSQAIELAASGLREAVSRHGADGIAALLSPQASLEALYLAQKLLRALGSGNVDHRLRQQDFAADRDDPPMPWLGCEIDALAEADAVLLIGANPRKEQPLLNLRLRESALAGGQVSFINPRRYAQTFDAHAELIAASQHLYAELAALAHLLDVPAPLGEHPQIAPAQPHLTIAESLRRGENRHLLLGSQAMRHPHFAALRALAAKIAAATGAQLGYLPEAANSAGAWLAGAVPHRGPAGSAASVKGQHAGALLAQPRASCLLLGVEPAVDCDNPFQAQRSLQESGLVVGLHSWADTALREVCELLLPIAAPPEETRTQVNLVGHWQTSSAAAPAPRDAWPAWKIIAALGRELKLDGFVFDSAEKVRAELQQQCSELLLDNRHRGGLIAPRQLAGLQRSGDVPPYCGDAMLRRASALQKSADAETGLLRLSPSEASARGLCEGQRIVVRQNGSVAGLPLHIDDRIPDGCAWIAAGTRGSELLGPLSGPVELEVE
jgi:NADH-quinone oxidoreductase subunit G